MAEKKVAAFADVLLGPLYGESYDLLITESRLLLVHVSPFNMKWKPYDEIGRDLKIYDRESLEAFAAKEKSVSVPFAAIREIGMKMSLMEEPRPCYLKVKYEREDRKTRKLKIMFLRPPGDQGMREFAMELQTALEKALPPDIAAKGSWLF